MRDTLLIGMVFLVTAIAVRRPIVGMLAFVCFGIINPQSFAWGFGRTFPLAQITALGTLVGYTFFERKKQWPSQREAFLLLALWGMLGLTTLNAMFPDRGIFSELAWDKFKYLSKILLMVFLSISIINTRERLHWLVRIIALSLGALGLKGGIFSVASGGNFLVFGPENTFLEANNAIGLALAMNVPILYYLIKIEPHAWLRKILWPMLIFSYPAVVCTFSRGAWLGLAAVTALIFLKTKYKTLWIMGGGLLTLLALPLFSTLLTSDLLPERVITRYDELMNYEQEASAQSRFWNWELCKRVGLANPLTGEGFDFYSRNMYAKYFPEFQERYGYEKVWTCHSMWLTVWAEHGIPAFALWTVLLTSCILSLRRLVSLAKKNPSLSWAGEYAHMLEGGILAFVICGTFLDIAYFDLYYQTIAIIVIIKEQVRQQLSHGQQTPSSVSKVPSRAQKLVYAFR